MTKGMRAPSTKTGLLPAEDSDEGAEDKARRRQLPAEPAVARAARTVDKTPEWIMVLV